MMTEVIQQKIRPRRSVLAARSGRRLPIEEILARITGLLDAPGRSLRGMIRSFRWNRQMRRVHVGRGAAAADPSALLGQISAAAGGTRAASKPLFLIGAALLLAFVLLFSAASALPSLWARGIEFSLPQEREIETLLQAYVEPPAQDVLEGGMKTPDPSRFVALSLSSRRIGQGETISAIAKQAGLLLDTIVSLNRIEDVRRVPVGADLKLPNQNGILYTVRRGDSLSSIGKAFNVGMSALADVNNLESATIHPGQDLFIPGARMRQTDLKRILGELFMYPSDGRFTSGFGMRNDPFTGVRRFHNGIDIAGTVGTPVSAAMAGKIVKIGVHPSYGRYIIMSHASGYQTWYAHLQKAVLGVGTTVAQGEMIGEMGNTGYSTGPHLHFSVFKNGSPVDPMRFLR